jgi:hypothetical protein
MTVGSWVWLAVVICGIMASAKVLACHVINVDNIAVSATSLGQWQTEDANLCECKFWVKVWWLSAGSKNDETWENDWLIEVYQPGDPNMSEPNDDYRPPDGNFIDSNSFRWDIEPNMFTGPDKEADFGMDSLDVGTYTLRAWVIRDGTSPTNAWKYSDPITVRFVKVASVSESATEVCVNEEVTFTANPSPSEKMLHCVKWYRQYRQDSNSNWGNWVWVNDGDTSVLNSDTPGEYIYHAFNGDSNTCATEANSIVTVVEVGDVNFSCTSVCVGGTCTASADIAPSGRDIEWSIPGESLGCSIDANTGVITGGNTPGTITVRAADANVSSCYKQANLVILNVELVIDGVADEDEEDVGGLVVLRIDDNGAPRKKITLTTEPATWSGDVTLTRDRGFVKVFDAAEGGNEITFDGNDNKFAAAGLPKDLWAQGSFRSFFMRDVTFTLTGDGTGCEDKGKFTVLWVFVSCDHTGSVESDNAAKALYESMVVPPPDDTLGQHLFCLSNGPREGRGSEFMGNVYPSDFEPNEFSTDPCALHLCREIVNGKIYWGPNGNENSDDMDPNDDTSYPCWRDDKPQSGGSNGCIYDLDGPGYVYLLAEPNLIMRMRGRVRWTGDQSVRERGTVLLTTPRRGLPTSGSQGA